MNCYPVVITAEVGHLSLSAIREERVSSEALREGESFASADRIDGYEMTGDVTCAVLSTDQSLDYSILFDDNHILEFDDGVQPLFTN